MTGDQYHRFMLTIVREIDTKFGKEESDNILSLYSNWLSNVINSRDLMEVKKKVLLN